MSVAALAAQLRADARCDLCSAGFGQPEIPTEGEVCIEVPKDIEDYGHAAWLTEMAKAFEIAREGALRSSIENIPPPPANRRHRAESDDDASSPREEPWKESADGGHHGKEVGTDKPLDRGGIQTSVILL